MGQKHLIWLLGVLVGLLGLALLTGVFDREISTVDVPELTVPLDRLEEIHIERPEAPLTLRRAEGRWHLAAPVAAPADSVTITQFLRDLSDLALESVVSTNPERYAHYGVDSTAPAITARWPGGDYRLIVGDQGPDFQTVYVRVGEDPRVFATRGRLDIPVGLDRWRDRTVLNVPPGQVASVQVERPAGAFEVRRGPEGWQVVDGAAAAPADSGAVLRWLGRFAPLRADGFIEAASRAGAPADSTYRITFRLTDETAPAVRLQPGEDGLAVTTSGDDVIYRLSGGGLETYVPDPSTLTGP